VPRNAIAGEVLGLFFVALGVPLGARRRL